MAKVLVDAKPPVILEENKGQSRWVVVGATCVHKIVHGSYRLRQTS